MSASIWWIRRDIRLADNRALRAAAAEGEVIPVFVIDPMFETRSGAPRLSYLYQSLASLDRSIGGALVYRRGDPAAEIVAVARETGARSVHVAADFAPYGRRRDAEVAEALSAIGARLVASDSPYAVDPGTVRKDDGTPLKVFTPFYKRWMNVPVAPPGDDRVGFGDARRLSIGAPGVPDAGIEMPAAGEAASWDRWHAWSSAHLDAYKEARDNPGVDGTSRLSTQLRFGVIHPRQLLAELGSSAGADHFRSELAWREFYGDVLFHQPDSMWNNLQRKMDILPVDTGARAEKLFAEFCGARTGYPIVDAGIRQMLATGWMHNRVRMIVASFLVKDLHLPWQWGARFFMRHLVDGDISSNNHGWQWTAGTGTDAAPYFRVFNPSGQSERFDPRGDYLRAWIPEIAHLDDRHIHSPWTLGLLAPTDYPAPIVDHAVEREEALSRYKLVSGK